MEKTIPKTSGVKNGCSTANPTMPPIGLVSNILQIQTIVINQNIVLGCELTIEKTMPKTRGVKNGCSTAKPTMPPIGSVSNILQIQIIVINQNIVLGCKLTIEKTIPNTIGFRREGAAAARTQHGRQSTRSSHTRDANHYNYSIVKQLEGCELTIEKTIPKTSGVKNGCSTANPTMPPIGSVSNILQIQTIVINQNKVLGCELTIEKTMPKTSGVKNGCRTANLTMMSIISVSPILHKHIFIIII